MNLKKLHHFVDSNNEQSRRWSPYNFAYNNPVYFIDPDGMSALGFDELNIDLPELDMDDWKPDQNGNLIAEAGDNTKTLAKFLDRSVKDVGENFRVKGESIGENYEFKEGQKVKLDNNVTRAIENSNGVTITEKLNGSTKSIDTSKDNYICDECAQMATNGEEINMQNATKYSQFPNPISNNPTPGFTQVGSFKGVAFNKGIASIGGEHTVSYYGTSNKGVIYVFSKDGRSYKPQVYSLQQAIDLYNRVQKTKFTINNDVRYYKKN